MKVESTPFSIGPQLETQSEATLTEASNEMGRDEFLKLLTTQISQQDPLEPLKNHEFVAQLAQFSSLEQQVLTNESLENLHNIQMSSVNGQLAQLVGKEIVAQGDTTEVYAGTAADVGVELQGPAATVDITIEDASGKIVSHIARSNLPAGSHQFSWNPRGPGGEPLPDGNYTVKVNASDSEGNPVQASTLTRGRVDEVTFAKGYPELVIGGRKIVPGQIISISQPKETTPDPFGESSEEANPQPEPSPDPDLSPTQFSQ